MLGAGQGIGRYQTQTFLRLESIYSHDLYRSDCYFSFNGIHGIHGFPFVCRDVARPRFQPRASKAKSKWAFPKVFQKRAFQRCNFVISRLHRIVQEHNPPTFALPVARFKGAM